MKKIYYIADLTNMKHSNKITAFQHKQNKSNTHLKIPKIITIFFIIIECCFGFNFGFIRSIKKDLRMILKLLSRFMAFVFVGVITTNFVTMKIFDIIYFTCDWVTYIAILIGSILCKYTVNDFIIDIHKINKDLRSSRFYKLCIFSFVIFYFIKLSLIFAACALHGICYDYIVPYYIFYIGEGSLDVLLVVVIIILYLIYSSVKKLRLCVKEHTVKVEEASKQYMLIADCIDRIKPLYNLLVSDQVRSTIPYYCINSCQFS